MHHGLLSSNIPPRYPRPRLILSTIDQGLLQLDTVAQFRIREISEDENRLHDATERSAMPDGTRFQQRLDRHSSSMQTGEDASAIVQSPVGVNKIS